jgi:hypothetical protein
VELVIVHEKNAAPESEIGKNLVLQKFGKGLLVIGTAPKVVRQNARLVNSNDQRHGWATVVGDPLDGTPASRSAAIPASDAQIEASLVNVDEVIHIARTNKDILGPLSSGLNALGFIVSF